jgi:hypothetical protein
MPISQFFMVVSLAPVVDRRTLKALSQRRAGSPSHAKLEAHFGQNRGRSRGVHPFLCGCHDKTRWLTLKRALCRSKGSIRRANMHMSLV